VQHLARIGKPEVEAFLTWVAVLFLYKPVHQIELLLLDEIDWPDKSRRLPVVLPPEEVRQVFSRLNGVHALLARLLYATGMRTIRSLCLQVKDIDFANTIND